MGMVKMEHVNIYGDGREPRAALELLAGLSCFDPDDAKAFVAQQSAQEEENMFEPLLAQALGLLKDLGKMRRWPRRARLHSARCRPRWKNSPRRLPSAASAWQS